MKPPRTERLAVHVFDHFDVPGIVDHWISDSHIIANAPAGAGAQLQ
jgi:hypothetical protein